MGKYYCCMTNCHNYNGRIGKFGKTVTLHKLPKHGSIRSAWIRAISRKNWKPSSYTRVCSDHFVDGVGPEYNNRLKVPTENLEQKKKHSVPAKPRKAPTKRNTTNLIHHVVVEADNNTRIEAIQLNHSYSRCSEEPTKNDIPTYNEDQVCESIQCTVETRDAAGRPEITIEDIRESKDDMMFYTGLPDFNTFNALFQSLIECGADKLCTEGNSQGNSTWKSRKLRRVDEFLMVLMRLRLGLLVRDLEYRFKISSSTVSKIFNAWIPLMNDCLSTLVYLPELDVLQQKIPVFRISRTLV